MADALRLQFLGAAGQPFCRDYDACPVPQDGGSLPLLPFLWGGNAANCGVYRSLPGALESPLLMGGAWSTAARPPTQTSQAAIFGPSVPLTQGTSS